MRKSPAGLILISLCAQGMLIPGFAQQSSSSNASATQANGPAAPYVPPTQGPTGVAADGSNAASVSQAAFSTPSAQRDVTANNYLLGAEDTITVKVFAADDIPDRPAQIANDGTVTLPMIGAVHAAGLTVNQLEAALVTAYKKYFRDPQVTVQVTDFRSQPVAVAGNVTNPGVVQLRGNRDLMEVIGLAGGLRADAGDSVLLTRNLSEGPIPLPGAFTDPTGKYSIAHINVRTIMSGKDPQNNILIKPHDVVTVPRARMIYVLGNVNKPGGYVMQDNEAVSLTQAIALAGGWNGTAALSGTRILRASGGSEREQIPANIKKIMENKQADVMMQPDDILYVPNSFAKAFSARSIEAGIGTATGIAVYR